jgi:putative transposase
VLASGGRVLGQGIRSTPGRKRGACDAQECVGRNPTDRGKAGVKKSVLVEADGGPLAVCIAGANIADIILLSSTLEAVVVERPKVTADAPQHLCLDKGYDNSTGYRLCQQFGYTPHIRRIGEEKWDETKQKTYPARRWVVERTFSWLCKCRALIIRWDKKAECYLGQIKVACALLWFRRLHRLHSKSQSKISNPEVLL